MNFEDFLLNESILDHKDHAARIRMAADRHLKMGLKRSAGDKISSSLYHSDHKTLHKIANHVENGEHKEALKKLDKMDTAAKEAIPFSQRNHIAKHGDK